MTASAVGRLWRPTMTAVKMPHVNVGRHFAAHVKWIILYNVKFWVFPEFIITPSLVVKLSTTTTVPRSKRESTVAVPVAYEVRDAAALPIASSY